MRVASKIETPQASEEELEVMMIENILNSEDYTVEEAFTYLKEYYEKLDFMKEMPYLMRIRDAKMYKALKVMIPFLEELRKYSALESGSLNLLKLDSQKTEEHSGSD